jgi:S1-C subfamily serine protease
VSFAPLTDQQKQYFNINSGVVVTNVRKGGFDHNGIPIGTIIAYINGKPINSSKDIDLAFCLLKRNYTNILRLHRWIQGNI